MVGVDGSSLQEGIASSGAEIRPMLVYPPIKYHWYKNVGHVILSFLSALNLSHFLVFSQHNVSQTYHFKIY